MEKEKVKIKETMPRHLLAERVKKLAQDLTSGLLAIQSSDKVLSLSPPESMPVEIKAKLKNKREKLVIEISWRELPAAEKVVVQEEQVGMTADDDHETPAVMDTGSLPEAAPEASTNEIDDLPEPAGATTDTAIPEPPCQMEEESLPDELRQGCGCQHSSPDEAPQEADRHEDPCAEETAGQDPVTAEGAEPTPKKAPKARPKHKRGDDRKDNQIQTS